MKKNPGNPLLTWFAPPSGQCWTQGHRAAVCTPGPSSHWSTSSERQWMWLTANIAKANILHSVERSSCISELNQMKMCAQSLTIDKSHQALISIQDRCSKHVWYRESLCDEGVEFGSLSSHTSSVWHQNLQRHQVMQLGNNLY